MLKSLRVGLHRFVGRLMEIDILQYRNLFPGAFAQSLSHPSPAPSKRHRIASTVTIVEKSHDNDHEFLPQILLIQTSCWSHESSPLCLLELKHGCKAWIKRPKTCSVWRRLILDPRSVTKRLVLFLQGYKGHGTVPAIYKRRVPQGQNHQFKAIDSYCLLSLLSHNH